MSVARELAADSTQRLEDTQEAPSNTAGAVRDRLRRARWPLVIVLAVVLVNGPALVGLVNVSPLVPIGGLGTVLRQGFLPGQWSLDPNIGITAQALGHRAALDWLHGIVPWWNPFEGLGSPLAAGMQSAAFFPPTLFLALPDGQLLFHMLLECIAGVATFYLLRELRFRPGIACIGGILFALDGTLAWYGSAGANPVPMLPLMLLGVERVYRRGTADYVGFICLAGGTALSVYSGFPEISYVEGLMTAVWLLYRLCRHPATSRLTYLVLCVGGVVTGLLLAAPILVPFLHYVGIADVGANSGALRYAFRSSASMPILGMPYVYGPLVAFVPDGPGRVLDFYFGTGGGYLTVTAMAVAGFGLVGARRERGLRVLLFALAAVLLLWVFGAPPIAQVLARAIPFTGRVNVPKYADVAFEMAFVILSCFGLEAISDRSVSRRRLLVGPLVTLAVGTVALAAAWPTIRIVYDSTAAYRPYPIGEVCWCLLMLVALCTTVVFAGKRGAMVVVGVLLMLDAAGNFFLPEMSAPRSEVVDRGLVAYLGAHLGEARYYGVGAVRPNYGSYLGLASLDVNDLPVPALWARYVDRDFPDESPMQFEQLGAVPDSRAVARTVRESRPVPDAFVTEVERLEADGVKYLVVNLAEPLAPSEERAGRLERVYGDRLAAIYRLPRWRHFFSTTGGTCRLRTSTIYTVVAACAAPADLVRLELDLPGWTATIGGKPVTISRSGDLVQSVRLPRGTSRLSFAYSPPGLAEGLGLGALGILLLPAIPIAASRLSSRRRRQSDSGAQGSEA